MVYTKHFLNSKLTAKLPERFRNHILFKDVKRVDKVFPKLGLPNCLDKRQVEVEVPAYSTDKIVPSKVRIGFSSTGVAGMWDIATMSMRGVNSCMHWENHHSCHLIGSMFDPCTGIVYMTDGKRTEYGKSIVKRAMVRLAYDTYGHKTVLLMDRIYTKTSNTNPYVYHNQEGDPAGTVAGLFRSFLERKVKKQLDVVWSGDAYVYNRLFIPKHPSIQSLSYDEMSLVDCQVKYEQNNISKDVFESLGIDV